jgi:hypothetical protein
MSAIAGCVRFQLTNSTQKLGIYFKFPIKERYLMIAKDLAGCERHLRYGQGVVRKLNGKNGSINTVIYPGRVLLLICNL